jgi:hypothetical protein
MKRVTLSFLLSVFAIVSVAQTNSITFPLLLSPTNSVLMTNAEFRVSVGNKLFFRSGDAYRSFHAGDLNPSVLAAISVTSEQLDARQKALDDAAKMRKEQIAALQAEQLRQRQLQILQAANADAAYEKQLQQQQESHGTTFYYTTPRQSAGIGAP